MNFESGGQAAIFRMVEAYGVTTRQAVCEKLGVSKSTMASRFMRDNFPAEWIIQCAFDTGVSLRWLATGEGEKYENEFFDAIKVPKLKLIDHMVHPAGFQIFDKAMIADAVTTPAVLVDGDKSYLVDLSAKDVNDGIWLVDIEGNSSIRKILRLPGQKIRVSNDELTFDCTVEDLKFMAKIDALFQRI